MATGSLITPEPTRARPADRSGLVPARLTVHQFEKMIGAGVFPEGVRAELLDGVVVTMTRYEPHNFCVGTIDDLIARLVPVGYHVREEKPTQSGRYWRPEPDWAIVRGARSNFRRRSPDLKQVVLAIEVAETTYQKDRGIKWTKYAACGIPIYWIVNLATRQVEVFTQPIGRGEKARYQTVQTFGAKDQMPVIIDGQTVGMITVREILP